MQNLLHEAVNCHFSEVVERVDYIMTAGQFQVSDEIE